MSLIYRFLLNNHHPQKSTSSGHFTCNGSNLKQKIKNTREKRIFVDEEEVKWRNKVIPYMIDLSTFSREYLYIISVSLCIPACIGLTVFHCLFVYIYISFRCAPPPFLYYLTLLLTLNSKFEKIELRKTKIADFRKYIYIYKMEYSFLKVSKCQFI